VCAVKGREQALRCCNYKAAVALQSPVTKQYERSGTLGIVLFLYRDPGPFSSEFATIMPRFRLALFKLPSSSTFSSFLLPNALSVVYGHQCSGHGSDEPLHVIPI
jgi:hypothetical protein